MNWLQKIANLETPEQEIQRSLQIIEQARQLIPTYITRNLRIEIEEQLNEFRYAAEERSPLDMSTTPSSFLFLIIDDVLPSLRYGDRETPAPFPRRWKQDIDRYYKEMGVIQA